MKEHDEIPVPRDLDEDLWVVLNNGRTGILLANPHTFPGRFDVWLPKEEMALTYSLSEIVEASPLAKVWLRGYLTGNEPGPEDFFGERSYDLEDRGPEMTAWRDHMAEFRRTGEVAGGECPACGKYQLPFSESEGICGACGAPLTGIAKED